VCGFSGTERQCGQSGIMPHEATGRKIAVNPYSFPVSMIRAGPSLPLPHIVIWRASEARSPFHNAAMVMARPEPERRELCHTNIYW
jgi:hypothetical protein